MPEQYQSNQVVNLDVNMPNGNLAINNESDEEFHAIKYNTQKGTVIENKNNATPHRLDIKCPSEGIFPYPNDCRRFYECLENDDELDDDLTWAVVPYQCPTGMIYNPQNESCDYPQNIVPPRKCPMDNTQAEDFDDNLSPETIDYDNDEQKMPPTSNGICPSAGYFGNPDDCSEFYQCVEDSEGKFSVIQFECPNDAIWDPNESACRAPEDIKTELKCRNLNEIDADIDDDEREEDDHEDDDISQNMNTNLDDFKVEDDQLDFFSMLEHDDSESDEVEAITTKPTAENAESAESTEQPTTPKESPTVEANKPVADDADDKKEKNDVTASTVVIEAPKESPSSEFTEKPLNTVGTASEFICPSDGFFAHPTNCRKYILCDDDFNLTLSCPPNEAYNSKIQDCTRDWSACPEAPKCEKDGQRFADPRRSEYYFLCSVKGDQSPTPIFDIQKYRCPEYMEYDQEQQKCIETELPHDYESWR